MVGEEIKKKKNQTCIFCLCVWSNMVKSSLKIWTLYTYGERVMINFKLHYGFLLHYYTYKYVLGKQLAFHMK